METKLSIEHAISLYRNAADISSFADAIIAETSELDRDQYLAILQDWRHQYDLKASAIRKAKVDRKGEGNGWAQEDRQRFRSEARTLMGVREGLKELARRHHATRRQPTAA